MERKKERKEVYLYSAFIVATTLKALRLSQWANE